MFEKFTTPSEAYNFKLGSALKSERKILEILADNIERAESEKVKDLLRTHQVESREHVSTIEEVFGLFEWDVEESSCPAIEGLEKEGKAMVKKTDDSFVDSVILQGTVEIEHYEIGLYENLIISANAIGRQDVVDALGSNVESEQAALEKAKALQAEVAAVVPAVAA